MLTGEYIPWYLKDLQAVPKNGLKVMSTFSCGGGSTMGYKLAGFDVIAANDIDPVMAENYQRNLNPKHYFLMPIKELVEVARADGLPEELYSLDILDGSPPCSSFSTAGSRDRKWGIEKKFREGQAVQVLDDLFFDFLDLVEVLRPKVVIAENVKGLIAGVAKGYVNLILKRFRSIGYRVQVFLINAADCGVPQMRERVFFVALRGDIDKRKKLSLHPCAPWITAASAIADIDAKTCPDWEQSKAKPTSAIYRSLGTTLPGESLAMHKVRRGGPEAMWSRFKVHPDRPSNTLTSARNVYHWSQPWRDFVYREYVRLGSFPEDYKPTSALLGKYIIGMSVPPRMMEYIAREVYRQWLNG